MTTVTLPDLAYQSLGSLGYTGSLVDRKFRFFKDNGAVSNNVVDAEFEWLTSLGYTQSTLVGKRAARLRNLGYTDLSGYTAAFDNLLYYSHRNLFLNNEQGAWYDPSDLSTLFQDSAGTTPVTKAGEPVGLVLDKSKGLVRGTELATAATWGAAPTGVASDLANATITFSGTQVTFAAVSLNALPAVIGKWYKVSFTVSGATQGQVQVRLGGVTAYVAGNGTFNSLQLATTTGNPIVQENGGLGSRFNGVVSNISVRELPGNHASQSTATARPIWSARYNIFERTEEFDNAYWEKLDGALVTANAATAPNGQTTADLLNISALPSTRIARNTFIVVPTGVVYRYAIWLKSPTVAGTWPMMWRKRDGTTVGQLFSLTTEWQKFVIDLVDETAGANSLLVWLGNRTAGGTLTQALAWGADLRVANESSLLPSYQRVVDATNYDTSGFLPYLSFDGVDDFLVTPSIDFTSTDKMTVVAGVRKMSDATVGCVCELSVTSSANNGAFAIFAPISAAANYFWRNKGTVTIDQTISGYAAPISNVLTGFGDISGDSSVFRVNGTQAAQSTADQGTGNYGNYPLYIGRRGGTSLPFNGRLYGLIVRGAASTLAQIIAAEREMAKRTGVVL